MRDYLPTAAYLGSGAAFNWSAEASTDACHFYPNRCNALSPLTG
jgi:hypothetical protein